MHSVESPNCEFKHLLPPFYPIFTCVDPYSENGSRKLLNTDPIRIRIHKTAEDKKKLIYF